jgi:hypothetical protein
LARRQGEAGDARIQRTRRTKNSDEDGERPIMDVPPRTQAFRQGRNKVVQELPDKETSPNSSEAKQRYQQGKIGMVRTAQPNVTTRPPLP